MRPRVAAINHPVFPDPKSRESLERRPERLRVTPFAGIQIRQGTANRLAIFGVERSQRGGDLVGEFHS